MEIIINELGNIDVIPTSSPTIEVEVSQPIIELNLNPVPIKGDSAYQVAVNNGFTGTEQEWLQDLKSIEWNSTNW